MITKETIENNRKYSMSSYREAQMQTDLLLEILEVLRSTKSYTSDMNFTIPKTRPVHIP